MNILVTGGCGFIGSNFITYMLAKYDYNIVNLDLLTYAGNLENVKNCADYAHYHFIKGDICDRELVMGVFKHFCIDVVIHFAAESHVDRSIANPNLFLKTNIIGTQTLLDIARQVWGKRQDVRFIQISTDEVYGTLGNDGSFTEESPLLANSPYSASKASADLFVRAYHQTYNIPVNITRCSNNYGPKQYREKLIPLVVEHALKEKPIPVYGDGNQIRDWLYVEDHCRAIDLVLHHGKNGEVYNIGGGNERKNLDVVKLILKLLGKSEKLIEFVTDRPGHDFRYAINYTKMTRELGWRPEVSFEEGMKRTIEWYLKTNKKG